MREALGHRRCELAGRAAYVAQRAVLREVDFLGQRLEVRAGNAAHRGHELLEARRIGVQLVEHRAAVVLDLVLRLTGFQCGAEVVPVAEEPRVQHLEHAADVAGLVLVEERRGVRRVAILARGAIADAVEEAERHEGVEEVVHAARVQPQHASQLRAGERARTERGEHAELHCRQQHLRGPERGAHFDDFGGIELRCGHGEEADTVWAMGWGLTTALQCGGA